MGRYLARDSIMHRLDPRMKLIGMIVLLLSIFLANNPLTYAIFAVFIAIMILLSGISIGVFLKGLRPMIIIILITVFIQLLFTRTGEVLVQFGPLAVTKDGLINAIYIFLRFVLIIFISTILTLTTQPLAITDGLESLFKPFRKLLPVHEMALMLAIALRFVPTLLQETDKIMDAQRARGVDFSEGNLVRRVKAIIPILIPLFVSAFDRAYDLSIAMESRGYRGGEGRTKYRILQWHKTDTVATAILIGVCVVVIMLRT